MYSIYYIDKCESGLFSQVKGKVGEKKRTTELLFKVTQDFAVIKTLHNHVLWRTMTALASGTIAVLLNVWMNIFRFDSDLLILDLQEADVFLSSSFFLFGEVHAGLIIALIILVET